MKDNIWTLASFFHFASYVGAIADIYSTFTLEQFKLDMEGSAVKFHVCLVAFKLYAFCCLVSGDTEKAMKVSEELLNILMSSLPADHPRIACGLTPWTLSFS
jgi:hypothetical protein